MSRPRFFIHHATTRYHCQVCDALADETYDIQIYRFERENILIYVCPKCFDELTVMMLTAKLGGA